MNIKEGGVNGVKLVWEECETEYNIAKGIECYERLKGKTKSAPGPMHVLSTGIAYGLMDKIANDKIPMTTIGYGRADTVDGSVFPWAFPLVTTYQMQVSAIVKYIDQKEGGKLSGKRIAFVYHDSAYGKEPIIALEAESKLHKFDLVQIPVTPPGNDQMAQWLDIHHAKPDWVIFWGWGVMNQTGLKAAQKTGFPRDHIIGGCSSGSEEDTIPAGDAAKGYLSATWSVSGTGAPLIVDIQKVVHGAGKGNMPDKSRIGSTLYNRGVSAAIISVEALRTAQARFGKGKASDGEQVRWALENLDITNARLKQIGATGLLPEIKTSCSNHEGSGKIRIQQWDGAKWVLVSDWLEGNKALIHPLFRASAKQYARENGITPRDCPAEW